MHPARRTNLAGDDYARTVPSWPDPRNLYVELSFHIDDAGTLLDQVKGSAGAVIDGTDAILIELLNPEPDAGSGA